MHSLNRLQREPYLHLPVVSLMVFNFCHTLCLDEISLIHTPAPQGNSRRYGYSANYCGTGRGGR